MSLSLSFSRALFQRSLGAGLGIMVDRVTPEPSNRYHPVAWLGGCLERLEHYTYQDNKAAGCLHTITAAGTTLLLSSVLRRTLRPLPAAEMLSSALAVTVSSGQKMLGDTALEIHGHLEAADYDAARSKLTHLVGRNPSRLDEAEICRAVVESVAENTVDAATAVISHASVLGVSSVLLHRTLNTLDAMVGHRNERYENFGWASAKADDVANWLPARLSVVAVAIAAATFTRPGTGIKATEVVRIAMRDGPSHPSPNAGLIEAAFAAGLGITLGGSNTYGDRSEQRAKLGSGSPAARGDIERAVELSNRTVEVLAVFFVAGSTTVLLGSKIFRRIR